MLYNKESLFSLILRLLSYFCALIHHYVPQNSKIRRFFFIVSPVLLILGSCQKEVNDIIPEGYYVNFTIDINDFPNLAAFNGSDNCRCQ
jgi:hypothetical protein